jgi:LmbE family N-acetylglucosaminyl deacetylase
MTELAAAARERGLPTGLWGLEPEDFGWGRDATLVLDVRPVLARKLAALRAHRTQVGADHLLAALPDDLAELHLGHEGWTGPADGPLEELLGRG